MSRHATPRLNAARRRAKKRSLAARDGAWCRYCGKLFADLTLATIDHVAPLSLFNTWANEHLVLACRPCNDAKADRIPLLLALLLNTTVHAATGGVHGGVSGVHGGDTAGGSPPDSGRAIRAWVAPQVAGPASVLPATEQTAPLVATGDTPTVTTGVRLPGVDTEVADRAPGAPIVNAGEHRSPDREHDRSTVNSPTARALTLPVWVLLARLAAAHESTGEAPTERTVKPGERSRGDQREQRSVSAPGSGAVRTVVCTPIDPTVTANERAVRTASESADRTPCAAPIARTMEEAA
ncbi:HNH endonuclease signature motif containing protein [Streptomyces sp. SL13]|uniref:HNH endonuclease signature motif containing protein n=1 Tax=Streptantibioticus silvisoli TaxID=2705255 RepID=A0AA90H7R6_9ACTN|nr:HNH endonuclease signature motif containing protein [Streptantibioticus silvisoli]MDI5969502.1 HNH endonuclease signature motif containing protein [Streptantibioticus silvisoli]